MFPCSDVSGVWRGGATVAILAVAAMGCGTESSIADDTGDGLVTHEATSNLGPVTTEAERDEHVHILDSTLADLRRVVEGMRAPAMGTGCDHWADPGSRAGILVPVPGAARLLVGERRDVEGGMRNVSIGTQRNYPVTSFRRSGSPIAGEIVITLQKAVADAERRCMEQMRGIGVKWLNWPGGMREPVAAEMVVRDVRFARAAVIGPEGDAVETGDTVAELTLAEGWLSMIYRELQAQFWGVVAGIVVTISTGLVVRAGRRFCRMWTAVRRGEVVPVDNVETGTGDEQALGSPDGPEEDST